MRYLWIVFAFLLFSCTDRHYTKDIQDCLSINVEKQQELFPQLNNYLIENEYVDEHNPESYISLVRRMKYEEFKIDPHKIFPDREQHVKMSEKHIFPAFYTCYKKVVEENELEEGIAFEIYAILHDMHRYQSMDAPFDIRLLELLESSDLENENVMNMVMYFVWRNLYISYFKGREDAPKEVVNEEL